MPTSPPIIDGAPTAPNRSDRATFAPRADAFTLWLQNAVPQFGAVAANVNANAMETVAAANSAISTTTANATSAQISAAAAAATSGATKWIAGNYVEGAVAWSPLNGQGYRNKTAGVRNVDPSGDPTNWWPIGQLQAAVPDFLLLSQGII